MFVSTIKTNVRCSVIIIYPNKMTFKVKIKDVEKFKNKNKSTSL